MIGFFRLRERVLGWEEPEALNVRDPVVGGRIPSLMHISCSVRQWIPAILFLVRLEEGIASKLNGPSIILDAACKVIVSAHLIYLVLSGDILGRNKILSP